MVKALRFHLSMEGMQVRSFVGELRPHMPLSQKIKTKNRHNLVTNSIAFKNGPH